MEWTTYGIMASLGLGVVAGIVGYPVCHFIVGPLVLQRSGKRKLLGSFSSPGDLVFMESELRDLAVAGDQKAVAVVKCIDLCKWLLILSLVSLGGMLVCLWLTG